MTREDLYAYYRRHYVPNNATLVIVGDVERADAMGRVVQHFGGINAGETVKRRQTREPEQLGERRVVVAREGTTAYLKIGFHAPAVSDPDFFPMLVLDAVLTGAKGLNLWASFRTPPPQRSARLYRALVDGGVASAVSGGLVPTQEPFLYTISATATENMALAAVEEATLAQIDAVRRHGITDHELRKAKNQLRARLVFEGDSISNIAHQLGFFETIASWHLVAQLRERIDGVALQQVGEVAGKYLKSTNRTVGWFDPQRPIDEGTAPELASAGAGPISSGRR
jgi:zinc protease